jgi:hypothetical protein
MIFGKQEEAGKKNSKHPQYQGIIHRDILGYHTAGDPMKAGLVWTHLRISEIIAAFKKRAVTIGRSIVKQLFIVFDYVKRQMCKCKSLKEVAHRNEQFEHIAALKTDFIAQGLPVLSIDTKKKELLGNFYRQGKCYTQAPICVNDHDFPSFAEGLVIPQGIHDVQENKCYLTIVQAKIQPGLFVIIWHIIGKMD